MPEIEVSIIHELKRRNVLRVAAAYIAVAWLAVQVAETLLPVFDFGPDALRVVVILVAIGFWPAVVVAWLWELTPDGLKPDEGKDRDPNYSRRTRERLNKVVIVFLVLAVAYFAVDKFVLSGPNNIAGAKEVSIAVMPFVNLSESDDMAFFSDGVAEDILGLLSRTRGLRCIARSSSFALRDPNIPAADIGDRLGVDYLLTGTLRHHERKIRLSVRLVETESETLVWSQNYDRGLDDVFAIQDDISRQVVDSVAPTLTASQTTRGVPGTENYVDYLRARHIYLQGRNNNDAERVLEAKNLFEDLLRDSPEYARAHAGLADVWSGLAILGSVTREVGYSRATASALRALELDSRNAEAWYALGDVRVEYDWDLPAAQAAYDSALAIAPKDADGLRGYAYFLRQAGRTDEALAAYNEALLIDPFSFRAIQGLYLTYVNGGRYADAEALIEERQKRNPAVSIEAAKAPIYANRREFERLHATLPQVDQFFGPVQRFLYTGMAERGLGDQAAGDEIILEVLDVPIPFVPKNFVVAQYFSAFNDFDRALEYLDQAVAAREIGLGEALTSPLLSELRKEPRFWDWVSRAGIKPLE